MDRKIIGRIGKIVSSMRDDRLHRRESFKQLRELYDELVQLELFNEEVE